MECPHDPRQDWPYSIYPKDPQRYYTLAEIHTRYEKIKTILEDKKFGSRAKMRLAEATKLHGRMGHLGLCKS